MKTTRGTPDPDPRDIFFCLFYPWDLSKAQVLLASAPIEDILKKTIEKVRRIKLSEKELTLEGGGN